MAEQAPNPDLLRALGRMVRGLSALFWGIPAALVICVQTARGDWLRPLGIVPPLLATALLWYALRMLSHFQKQERPWQIALERAQVLALVAFGLSPFLFWWSRLPSNLYYNLIVDLLILTGLLFLYSLNPLLRRLSAMLPDETLRHETRAFTSLNAALLVIAMVLGTGLFLLQYLSPQWDSIVATYLLRFLPAAQAHSASELVGRFTLWLGLFFVLIPVSTTMALVWKTKEVILISIFGPDH